MIEDRNIDGGKGFDWGKASEDYAKYRDIYPAEFYQKLLEMGIGTQGQKILDIGTGTGVLPRNLYRHGAEFIGTDISEQQILQAKRLAEEAHMNISFFCSPAEECDFPEAAFDAVTACQCFFYFDHAVLAPRVRRILKEGGKLILLYMAWLPFEDKIAGESEALVLKYNPSWTGCGEQRHPIQIPEVYDQFFTVENSIVFDLPVPFTRESWNGRMKACRGIGASLSEKETEEFDREHRLLLEKIAPERFEVLHYAAMAVLKAK